MSEQGFVIGRVKSSQKIEDKIMRQTKKISLPKKGFFDERGKR